MTASAFRGALLAALLSVPALGLAQSINLDLGDPREHPEFYEIENSVDPGHLNSQGAAIFTRRLAEEFIETLRE